MATEHECEEALRRFAAHLGASDDERRDRNRLERTVSCHVPDLGVTFHGLLKDAEILDITTESRPRAQLRLTANSDDLVKLVEGEIDFIKSWTSGRIKVQASVMDLMRLRSLF
jgi:hypothetical protein